MSTRQQVLTALEQVIDPELRRNVVELEMVRDIVIGDEEITVTIALTTPGCPLKANIAEQVQRQVGEVAGGRGVLVAFTFMNEAEREALREKMRGGRQYRKPGVAVPAAGRGRSE